MRGWGWCVRGGVGGVCEGVGVVCERGWAWLVVCVRGGGGGWGARVIYSSRFK